MRGKEYWFELRILMGLVGVQLAAMRDGIGGKFEVDATIFNAQTPREAKVPYDAVRAAMYQGSGSFPEVITDIVETPPPYMTILGYAALRTAIDHHVSSYARREVNAGKVKVAEADQQYLIPWASTPISRVAMRAMYDERIYSSTIRSGRPVTASSSEMTDLINQMSTLWHERRSS